MTKQTAQAGQPSGLARPGGRRRQWKERHPLSSRQTRVSQARSFSSDHDKTLELAGLMQTLAMETRGSPQKPRAAVGFEVGPRKLWPRALVRDGENACCLFDMN